MPILVSNDILTELVTKAACPRCGYELRGIVDSWTESCPLLGVCSECGLEFAWSEVLCPEKYEPLWCVESAGAGSFLGASFRTLLMSVRPWRFWSELMMSHEIRWRRLVGYLLMFLMPLLLLYVVEQATLAVRVRMLMQRDLLAQQQSFKVTLSVVQQQFAVVLQTETDPVLLQQWQSNLAYTQQMAAAPAVISGTNLEAALEAVFLPLRRVSGLQLLHARGNGPYPAPRTLHLTWMAMESRFTGRNLSMGVPFSVLVIVLVAQLALLPGLPVGFLLLPVSRKRAKVRWAHLGRVAAYSVVIPFTILYATTAIAIVEVFASGRLGEVARALLIGLQFGVGASLLLWWAMAIRRYLKIPHAWPVVLSLATITITMVVMAFFLLAPSFIIRV